MGKGRSVLSSILAVLCAAALIWGAAAAWLVPGAGLASGGEPIRISEVMTAGGDSPLKTDWIEIENTSAAPIDLTGYALMRETRPTKALAFSGATLEPGGWLVVYCDGSEQPARDGMWHAPFKLSAAGDTVLLLGRSGRTADEVTTPALSGGRVYCRDDGGAWTVSDIATPGEANIVGAGELSEDAATLSVAADTLIEITEVMTRNATYFPDDGGACCDYIELHNAAGVPVDLEDWALSDDREEPRKWVFPSVTLEPDGYLAVRCSGASRKDDPNNLHAGFRLSREGEELWLTDPKGGVASHVNVPALSSDQAYSRLEAGWRTSQPPTPGQPNDPTGADAAADTIMAGNPFGVYITELLATSNKSDDWIEVYNASQQPVDLSGFGLSDNSSRPRKWLFPSGTVIQPMTYMGIFCDGGDASADGNLHAGFRLNADGGYCVTLSDAAGNVFDRLFVTQQYSNMSYGRPDTMQGTRYFRDPTPGAPNGAEGYYGRAPQPSYSVRGGLYQSGEQLSVELSAPSGFSIHYTLDCKDPDEDSALYTSPIQITGTTILRTRVYREGYMESVMDTQSYLFNAKNGGGAVYVVSLVSDPYNLTSKTAGILSLGHNAPEKFPYGSRDHGANFWMDWEREAHVEVFTPDGETLISQECGTKLHGTHSRPEDKKAFKVIARAEYGSNRFDAQLFTRRENTQYQSFVLRTGSQDAKRTHMRDAVLQQLAADTPMLYQEYEIGVMYLNGEYWGHYNIRERINATSICQWEGWEGDEDALDIVKSNDIVLRGSNDTMKALLSWLGKHDPSTDEAYDAIDSAVDIDSYIEYIAIEMFTGNTDTLNVKRYRNPLRDGKWRWVMFDLDCAFDFDTNSVNRWLDPEGMGRAKNTDNRLFVAGMKNARFRERFLTYLGEKMATTYTTEHIMGLIEDYYSVSKTITADDLKRWNVSKDEYEEELRHLVNYTKSRPKRMLQYLKYSRYLKLTREEMERFFHDAMEIVGVTYDEISKAPS